MEITPFHTVIVSRYISFFEMFKELESFDIIDGGLSTIGTPPRTKVEILLKPLYPAKVTARTYIILVLLCIDNH